MVVETEVREVWGKKIEFLLAVVCSPYNLFLQYCTSEKCRICAIMYAKSVGYFKLKRYLST